MKFRLRCLVLLLITSCNQESTNLPSYNLAKFHIKMSHEMLAELKQSYQAKRPFPSNVEIEGKKIQANIHFAGKSTLDAFKKSFHIDFVDQTYQGYSSIRLSAQFVDDSMLRSLVGFKAYDDYQVMSPKIQPVVVYLNEQYQGLYQMIEPVDESFFERRNFNLKELYKAKLGNAGFEPEFLPRIKEAYSIRTEPKTDHSIRLLWELVLDDSADSLSKIEKILNIQDYLKYIAVSVVLHNWDGFNNNYFLARSKDDGLFYMVAWDLDRILEDREESDQFIYGANRLTEKILANENYRNQYLGYLRQAYQQSVQRDLINEVDTWNTQINEAYNQDIILSSRGSIDETHQSLKNNITDWFSRLDALIPSAANEEE